MVKVKVESSGKRGPYFIPRVPIGYIEENVTPMSVTILTLSTFTFDTESSSGLLTYTYTLLNYTDVFIIQANSALMAKITLNSNVMPSYSVAVSVSDSNNPPYTSSLVFQVNVLSADIPPSRPMSIMITALNGVLPAGLSIADVSPVTSKLSSATFTCTGGSSLSFAIVTGCQLQAGLSAGTGTYVIPIMASDGIHSIKYNISVTVAALSVTDISSGSTTLFIDQLSPMSLVNSSYSLLITSIEQIAPTSASITVCDVTSASAASSLVTLTAKYHSNKTVVPSATLVSWLTSFTNSIVSRTGLNIISVDYNPCSNVTCLNGGRCVSSKIVQGNYHSFVGLLMSLTTPILQLRAQCQCTAGVTGVFCESVLPSCSLTLCQHGGVCMIRNGAPICTCLIGWSGSLCDSDIDECQSSNACSSNAKCVNTAGSFSCISVSCNSLSCQHGGSCQLDSSNVPRCLCTPDAYGSYCEKLSTSFGALSYVQYDNSFGASVDSIAFEFASIQTDSLLAYTVASQTDFMAVELVSGQLRFTYGHASISPVVVYTTRFLADGLWHRVEAVRKAQVCCNIINVDTSHLRMHP